MLLQRRLAKITLTDEIREGDVCHLFSNGIMIVQYSRTIIMILASSNARLDQLALLSGTKHGQQGM